jgi:hypothetical protein
MLIYKIKIRTIIIKKTNIKTIIKNKKIMIKKDGK